jgi:hypothetical protein
MFSNLMFSNHGNIFAAIAVPPNLQMAVMDFYYGEKIKHGYSSLAQRFGSSDAGVSCPASSSD